MRQATTEFFEELGRRGHEPLIAKFSGRVRFDLIDDDHVDRWLVTIDRGDIRVAHRGGPRTCTMTVEADLFERIVRGEENAMSAVLRGALVCTGDVDLLLAIQKIFPGPRSAPGAAPVGRSR
jgi:putative sterol carrier protein